MEVIVKYKNGETVSLEIKHFEDIEKWKEGELFIHYTKMNSIGIKGIFYISENEIKELKIIYF